jgi:hypothetical protein
MFQSLPLELLHTVLQHTDLKTVASVSGTNKQFNRFVSSDTFTRDLIKREYNVDTTGVKNKKVILKRLRSYHVALLHPERYSSSKLKDKFRYLIERYPMIYFNNKHISFWVLDILDNIKYINLLLFDIKDNLTKEEYYYKNKFCHFEYIMFFRPDLYQTDLLFSSHLRLGYNISDKYQFIYNLMMTTPKDILSKDQGIYTLIFLKKCSIRSDTFVYRVWHHFGEYFSKEYFFEVFGSFFLNRYPFQFADINWSAKCYFDNDNNTLMTKFLYYVSDPLFILRVLQRHPIPPNDDTLGKAMYIFLRKIYVYHHGNEAIMNEIPEYYKVNMTNNVPTYGMVRYYI